jgi:RNA polymerase sigma-70 factor (ECF subfamily)
MEVLSREHAMATRDEPLEFSSVYRAHVQQVARWVARLGGSAVDVDDLVQDIFITAHRLLPEFRGEAKISTWLYRLTENAVRTRRRRERFRRLFTFNADVSRIEAADRAPTPLEDVERKQSAALIYRALDRISEKYRTTFILFELEGHSGEQIAELTGVEVATVWVRLTRARKQLADAIEKQRGAYDE